MRHSRGLERCQPEVWAGGPGLGSRSAQVVSATPAQAVLAGVERMVWAVGPEGTACLPPTPRVAPAPWLKLYKE